MDRRIMFALICAHVLVPIVLIFSPAVHTTEFAHTSDAARYFTIAHTHGVPYRDFEVEYPPVAVVLSKAIPFGSFDGFVNVLILTQALCDAAIAYTLFRAWGRSALGRYLLFSLPFLPLVLSKYDLLATALLVGGLALVARRRDVGGGVAVAGAVLAKLFAGAFVPLMMARRQWRAAGVAIVATCAGLVAWVSVCGFSGVDQVLTFRHARGWHAESLPGVVLGLVTSNRMRFEAGSWRLGAPPFAATALLTLGFAWYLAVVCRKVRRSEPIAGVAETGIAAALLVCAPLLSPQFLIWIVPWIAVAGAAGARRVERWGVAAAGLTLLITVLAPASHADHLWVRMLFLARGLLLVGTCVQVMASMRSSATLAHSDVSASTTI